MMFLLSCLMVPEKQDCSKVRKSLFLKENAAPRRAAPRDPPSRSPAPAARLVGEGRRIVKTSAYDTFRWYDYTILLKCVGRFCVHLVM